MSVRTMARVWADSEHSGTHLLMLLAIADFADDDGNAYPAVPTLASKCRMKPRNANVILAALRKSGELEIRTNEGPRGTNLYRVLPGRLGVQERAGVQSLAGVQERALTPAKACSKPLQRITDEPSFEPSLNRHERDTPPRPPAAAPKGAKASAGIGLLLEAGVEQQAALDWLALRRAKKLPLTVTAMRGIKDEAAKAGLTVAQVVEESISRGWGSFKAAWLERDAARYGFDPTNHRDPRASKQAALEARNDNAVAEWLAQQGVK